MNMLGDFLARYLMKWRTIRTLWPIFELGYNKSKQIHADACLWAGMGREVCKEETSHTRSSPNLIRHAAIGVVPENIK